MLLLTIIERELGDAAETPLTGFTPAASAPSILLTYLEEERLSHILYLSYKPVIVCSSLLSLPFLSNCQAMF